jgi:DNA polymerase-4
VRPAREEKSVSAARTFATAIRGARELNSELLRLIDRTASRLRAQGLVAGRIMIKIRRRDFTTETRQRRLGSLTQETANIASVAMALLDEWLRAEPTVAVRLLGVGAGDLQVARQGDLFAQVSPKESRIDAAVDDIRRRFGTELMTRASLLEPAPDAAKRRAST